MEEILKVLLLQLFWLSFALIGAAILILYARYASVKKHGIAPFLKHAHPIVALLVALATGMAAFVVVVVPATFLELQIVWIQLSYGFALIGSLLLLFARRQVVIAWFKKRGLSKRDWLWILAVGAVLAVDYAISLRTGGQLAGDAKFELARINLFANKYLSLSDPIFGDNGIPVTIYSTNILHALQAMIAHLLDVSAAWVWYYSHSFFRFVIWMSMFAVAWELLKKTRHHDWAYIVLLLAPFLYGNLFLDPELHNRIVIAWAAVFLIGIKVWLEKGSAFLLAVGAILIATSHPLNAVMAAGFLGLVSIVLAAFRLIDKRQMTGIIPIFLALFIPIGLYFYYPHGITSAGFNDTPSSGPAYVLLHLGPVTVGHIRPSFGVIAVAYLGILAAYLALANRVADKRLRLGIFGLVVLGGVLTVNPVVASLFGYIYLIVNASNTRVKIALTLLVAYLGLLLYNPLLLSIVHGEVPLWALSRFQDFNALIFIAPIIGFLCLIVLPLEAWKYGRLAKWATLGVIPIFLFILPVVHALPVSSIFVAHDHSMRMEQLRTLEELGGFEKELHGQVVFSDDPDLPALIPSAVVANVFSIYNEANAHPSVHIDQRKKCTKLLVASLPPNDLQASGITAIITTAPPDSRFGKQLQARPDVTLLKHAGKYRVYKVHKTHRLPADYAGVCAIPPTQK